MTATPHSGKEEDFQLFLTLLDRDRFEGKYQPKAHNADTSGVMRRMITASSPREHRAHDAETAHQRRLEARAASASGQTALLFLKAGKGENSTYGGAR
jgi:hypothetical protein